MKKFYCTCGLAVLALAACSDDNSANALGENPPPVADTSSCSMADVSSSSAALSSVSEVSSSSGAKCGEELWNPSYNQDFTVRTNSCVDAQWPGNVIADGRWFVTTDSAEGGKSSVVYMENSLNGAVSDSVIEQCNGVCGTAVLEKGSLTYNPFVSIGFKIAKDSSGNPIPVDVSNWNGICITYESDAAPALELDLGDSLNKVIDGALPVVSLHKASGAGTGKCLQWSDFKQPSWYQRDVKIDGETAAKQLVGVRFKIQALTGEKYGFGIGYIGAGDGKNYPYLPGFTTGSESQP